MEANNQINTNGGATCSGCGKPIFEIENKFITEENTLIVDAVDPQSDTEVFF